MTKIKIKLPLSFVQNNKIICFKPGQLGYNFKKYLSNYKNKLDKENWQINKSGNKKLFNSYMKKKV